MDYMRIVSHVYRDRSQRGLAPAILSARKLSGRRQGQEAHAAQPQRLATQCRGGFARLLKGRRAASGGDGITIKRSLPHGHVAACSARCEASGSTNYWGRRATVACDLVVAMIVARLIAAGVEACHCQGPRSGHAAPVSAVCSAWERSTRTSFTRRSTGCSNASRKIEAALARRHLSSGTLVLYDVTSSYLEGRCARSLNAATIVIASAASCKSCTASVRPRRLPRRQSRCSKARRVIR